MAWSLRRIQHGVTSEEPVDGNGNTVRPEFLFCHISQGRRTTKERGKKMRGNGTITLPPIRGTSGRHPLPVTSGWLHFRRVGMGWRLGDFPGTWEVVRLVDRVMGSFS
jgi:hypothetical protein